MDEYTRQIWVKYVDVRVSDQVRQKLASPTAVDGKRFLSMKRGLKFRNLESRWLQKHLSGFNSFRLKQNNSTHGVVVSLNEYGIYAE